MKRSLAGSLLLLAVVASPAVAQSIDGATYDKGAEVTIQGCIVAGQDAGTFVITHLQEWPVGHSNMGKFGPRSYWVDTPAAKMSSMVGQTVQFKGTIKSVSESEIEREPGGWNGGVRVAIELPGNDVKTTPTRAGIAADQLTSRVDKKITLLEFNVDEVIVVLKTCLGSH